MIAHPHEAAAFGALLKAFRTRQHLTQQQLAQAIGMHRHAISRWEQGDVLPASKALVLELAKLLQLDDQEARHLLEASLAALSPHFLVPLPRNPFFTGREAILEALHSQLGVKQAVALSQSSALHGLGGVGKTQIALEYAYRHALEYSAVFWIGAETGEQVVSSLLRIASVLHLPGRDDTDQQRVVTAVRRWLSTHGQWLVIWDNVEDLAMLDRFLPPARSGAVLLTTRSPALGMFAQGMDLLPMEQEEGLLFLVRRAKVLSPQASGEQVRQLAARMPSEYRAAEAVVMALGGLPLALDQAGAYIEETGCSLADYLQRYQQHQAHLLDRRGTSGGNHPHAVTTTFRLSREQAEREQQAAADLLCVCALLHAEAIPEELFVTGAAHLGPELQALAADPCQLDQAIAVLRRLALIQRQAQTHTLSLHRLVQAVLCEHMREQAMWLRRVIAALNAAFPEVTPPTWGQCERLLPHVLAVATTLPDGAEDQELAEVLRKAATYLCDHARYAQAEPLYQRALRLREQALGPEHLEVASFLDSLAILSFRQGKYERAEPLYQRALNIWERILGPEHPHVTKPLYGLARLNLRQGRYEQAESLYQRALHIWEQTLGPEHPDVAKSLDGLAILYSQQGRYEQAEPLYQRALHIWEQALGPEHPLVAHALNGLADLSYEQGQDGKAEPLYQRALNIWERTLGPEHPDVAYPLMSLADLSIRQGKDRQARLLYERALSIWEQALGPEHPEVAYPLNGLANLYQEQGKHAEAERLFQRALCIRERHLGPQHPETAQTLHDLAIFRQKQGKLSEALSLAEHTLSIRSQSLGDAHPKTHATQALYAQLVQDYRGTQKEALPDRGRDGRQAERASPPENDPLQGFLEACCDFHPRAWCRSADLWQAYVCWAQHQRERYPLSRGAFIAQVKAHGCWADRTRTARLWRGIALVKPAP